MSALTPFERAAARIDATPELEPYRAMILYDWHVGDAHFTWAATCDLAELLDWARAVTAAAEGTPISGPHNER